MIKTSWVQWQVFSRCKSPIFDKCRKMRRVEVNAKCHHLKKLTCKGTLRRVFVRVYRLEISSFSCSFLRICSTMEGPFSVGNWWFSLIFEFYSYSTVLLSSCTIVHFLELGLISDLPRSCQAMRRRNSLFFHRSVLQFFTASFLPSMLPCRAGSVFIRRLHTKFLS